MSPIRYVAMPDSARAAPPGAQLVGPLAPDAPLALTLYFRRRSAAPPAGGAQDLARLERRRTRASLAAERARTHARAATRIANFLRDHGVSVLNVDLTRRRMEISAPAGVLTRLFRADVALYRDGAGTFRARTGPLRLPRHIAAWVRAIVGFDNRPLPSSPALAAAEGAGALWPSQVGALYGAPLDRDVSGQTVGIVALGGGILADDLTAASTGAGLRPARVVEVGVGGAAGRFGADDRADEETALDLQVLAALLPGARIVVYFAYNNQQGIADALEAAVHDAANNPTVVSVSWGGPELHWTAPRREALNATLCDAARLGVTVVAATGDDLATCNEPDGKAHVWFPASSPYAVAVGGTTIQLAGDAIAEETVWNIGAHGTGGGVSDVYQVASFQTAAAVPPSVSTGKPGRGTPDVAAMAVETPGYRIVVNGEERNLGGTSAAAPLWAGLIAIANSHRAASLGLVGPKLYAAAGAFRPIRRGDNKRNGVGYDAGADWNACCGLGAPVGAVLVQRLSQ